MTPQYIVNHHSLTKDQETPNWCSIRQYHVRENHWIDVGYHFGLERVYHKWVREKGDEDIYVNNYEIFVGRMLNQVGAHCRARGFNHKSIGICWVGNYDIAPPLKGMWDLGVRLNKSLCKIFNINPINVVGHREVANDGRTCPGSKFDMDKLRSLL